MISFIDENCSVLGVEPICRLLPIAPSTYYEVVAKRTDVGRLSRRAPIARKRVEPAEFLLVDPAGRTGLDAKNKNAGLGKAIRNPFPQFLEASEGRLRRQTKAGDVILAEI